MGSLVAIVVAVIAALASIVAANLSYRSSIRASKSAGAIADRNQRLAALDREADQLRADFASFLSATGEAHGPTGQTRLLAADAVLGANPRCSDELREAADTYTAAITTALRNLKGQPGAMLVEAHLESLRTTFRTSWAALTEERRTILDEQVP